MQVKFIIRNKLPSVVPCTIACNPAVGNGLAETPEARVTARITVHETLESRVASAQTMSTAEARDLAARLVKAANEADEMLARMLAESPR